MELEEVIERLEKLLKLRLNKANEIKYDNCIIATEDLQIILKYIKEESILKAVVEEKIEEIDYSYKNIEKNYTEEQLDNYDVSEEDYIEMKKREFAEMILQEILNKGE